MLGQSGPHHLQKGQKPRWGCQQCKQCGGEGVAGVFLCIFIFLDGAGAGGCL